MAENSITMLQITDHPPHPNLIRCWNLMKGDQSTGIIDFWWMERFIFQKRQRKTKANSFVRLTMESTSRLANWLHWKSMVNIECLFFYSFYIFFLHLCIIGEREKKRLLTSPNITATAADAGNGNEIWIHFGDFFSKNDIGFFFEKVLPFLKFGLFHFWEEAFFYKKKKIWYISQARPFQFNKDHPSIFAPPRRRKTWCTPYLLHCTSEEPCFSSFNFMKERELYFAFFSVCMYSFLCSFAANWRVKIRKFCDFEKCILSGFSNCKFCNYWISKKRRKKNW